VQPLNRPKDVCELFHGEKEKILISQKHCKYNASIVASFFSAYAKFPGMGSASQ
jgi:hypothetical protein